MYCYFTSESKLKFRLQNDCNNIFTKIPTANIKANKFGHSVSEDILQFETFEK